MKANSKSWSAIQRRDKHCKISKHFGPNTDQENFKVAKIHLKKMMLKKKKFEEVLDKNRNKPREFWKALKSLNLSSNKAKQTRIYLKKDGAV